MLSRLACTLFALALSLPLAHADDGPRLEPGKKVEGEVGKKFEPTSWPGYVDSYYGYMAHFSVYLKAGSKITINAAVLGKGRRLAIALVDETNTIVAATKRDTDVSQSRLVVTEVSATGVYTIRLVSNQIGAYTLIADFPKVEDEKSLELKIEQLRKELADAESRLKELRLKK
jgi:hypothetical protein